MPKDDQKRTENRGRKPKLTPKARKSILESIRNGVPIKYAAQKAGIDQSTFYRWMRQGKRDKKGIFCQFRHAIQRAEAETIEKHVSIVLEAAEKTWGAAAWWLERRYHLEFGKKDQTIVKNEQKDSNLGSDVRERIREADGESSGQPGQTGGAGSEVVADTAAPSADQQSVAPAGVGPAGSLNGFHAAEAR